MCFFAWGFSLVIQAQDIRDSWSPPTTTSTWVLSCFSHLQSFVTLWTVACQAPLSMGFSRQEYWSGLPFPSPGDLPDAGVVPGLLCLLHWRAAYLPLVPAENPYYHQWLSTKWLTGGGVKIPNSFALGWDNSEVCVLHLLPGFQSKTKPQWPIMITCMKMHQLIPVMLKLALLSLIGLTCIMWCFWTNHHPWSGWSDLGHTSTLRINFTRITKDWGWERERNQRPFPESIVIRCGTVKEQLSSITDRGLRFTEKEKRFFFH